MMLTNKTDDPFDLDRLRLPGSDLGSLVACVRPPRHRPGETFLRGPIPFEWMAKACRLPGHGLHVASTVLYLCRRFRKPNRWGLARIGEALGISNDSAQRGLHAAEEAGLISAVREPGCKIVLTVCDLPNHKDYARSRPLYGPIPWLWWSSAARLPGKSLHVGAACWLSAGWLKSGEFELGLSDWSELGLSRFSAGRGLECLAEANLVKVSHRSGQRPLVRLLDGRIGVAGRSNVELQGTLSGVRGELGGVRLLTERGDSNGA